ncbi:hypothetical protein [Streptomyces sp. NPDC048419]|uniref:hypothetical protein n=1 Tax=Streptomyces sp. NPDC048419 TaxID=3365547 RepID=UPI00371B0D5B
MGQEGPGELVVLVDAVNALFSGVGDIGEVFAGEVGEFAFLIDDPRSSTGLNSVA